MESMFAGCRSQTSLNFGNFNTSKITAIASILSGCYYLESLGIEIFDVSHGKIFKFEFIKF